MICNILATSMGVDFNGDFFSLIQLIGFGQVRVRVDASNDDGPGGRDQ